MLTWCCQQIGVASRAVAMILKGLAAISHREKWAFFFDPDGSIGYNSLV
jgi:hypothetical protein